MRWMIGPLVTVCFFWTGCMAYRLQGHALTTSAGHVEIAGQYRIDRVSFVAPNFIFNPWSIPQTAKMNTLFQQQDTAIASLMRHHPNVLNPAPTSEGVSVSIRILPTETRNGWSVLFPYLCTLSIFPAFPSTITPCDVTVTSIPYPASSASCRIQFQSDSHVTVLSPIGFIGYDPPPVSVYRLGSGVMAAPYLSPTCKQACLDVFDETLANAVITCIAIMEDSRKKAQPQPLPAPQTPVAIPAPQTPVAVPQQPAPQNDISERVRKLNTLRDQGLITQEEWIEAVRALVK